MNLYSCSIRKAHHSEANHPVDKIFGEYLRKQASLLGVPVAHATSTGLFDPAIPNPKSSLAMLAAMYPSLLNYRFQFDNVRMEGNYFNETYIADSAGTILQSVEADTEGFAISHVIMPDSPGRHQVKYEELSGVQPDEFCQGPWFIVRFYNVNDINQS